jgi:Flp pilus assembly protein TadG
VTATARTRSRRRGTRADERGSALVLAPAGVLIVLILASIAVDMSLVHLRKRQAFDLAAAAANDAATAGADQAQLRSGRYVLDAQASRGVVADVVATSHLAPHLAAPPSVSVADGRVVVEIALEADYIFAGVVPGAPDVAVVTARAAATAEPPPP